MNEVLILQFNGKEFIAQVLERMPEAQEIFMAHGLSCAGCHVNVYETVEQGVLGHGMSQEDLSRLLEDLNEAAKTLKIPKESRKINPYLTKRAKKKILEFQAAQDQSHYGFKIEVLEDDLGKLEYDLDFLEVPEKGDRVIESLGINLFLDKPSLEKLMNCEIDFVTTEEGDVGFKIEKVSESSEIF